MHFDERRRYLPKSKVNYVISSLGKVFDDFGNEILPVATEQGNMVEIDWTDGTRRYPISLLVLVTFTELFLKEYFWDKIEPLHKNGDLTDDGLTNLIYRFKDGPIEVQEWPGYYYIPFNLNYAIDRNGSMITVRTGFVKTWYMIKDNPTRNQKGGYEITRVINCFGYQTNVTKHRCLGYTFIPYDHTVMDLVIDHVSGVKKDSSLENLEWVTHQENNRRALANGLTNRYTAILMKNLKTGEVTRYPSIKDCLQDIGKVHESYIYHKLVDKDKPYAQGSIAFKYDDGEDWPPYRADKDNHRKGGIPAIGRNVFTGEEVTFSGSGVGEKLTGVKKTTIQFHIRTNCEHPTAGWLFKPIGKNPIVWPTFTDAQLVNLKSRWEARQSK